MLFRKYVLQIKVKWTNSCKKLHIAIINVKYLVKLYPNLTKLLMLISLLWIDKLQKIYFASKKNISKNTMNSYEKN